MTTDAVLEQAREAIVAVDGGRGFIARTRQNSVVVTAAHCLPGLPPANIFSHPAERTCPKLLGPLGDDERTIWAECLFVDPVADVAVLGGPEADLGDDDEDVWSAYEALIENRPDLRIGTVPDSRPAWLLTLNRRWERCTVEPVGHGRVLKIVGAPKDATTRGTSGSPIVTEDGCAVGIISGGKLMNPNLSRGLPAWLLDGLKGGS